MKSWFQNKFRWVRFWKNSVTPPQRFFPEIQNYLDQDLEKRLGLLNIRPFQGHYQNAIAETTQGKVFINFFVTNRFPHVNRAIFAHKLLQSHGFKVPEHIFVDVSQETMQKYNVCCIVSRWIPGKSLQKCTHESKLDAFRLLAKIHHITLEGLDKDLFHNDFMEEVHKVGIQDFIEVQRETLTLAITAELVESWNVEKVFSLLEMGLSHFLKSPSPVLLHRDFHPKNLIESSDGEITILDLETTAFGPFFLDLSKALVKFCADSKYKKRKCFDIAELRDSPDMKSYENSYFSNAIDEYQAIWESHGSFFLFMIFLKIIRQLSRRFASAQYVNPGQADAIKAELRQYWEAVISFEKCNKKQFS